MINNRKTCFFKVGGSKMAVQYEDALENLLWLSTKLIGARTLFVSHIEETFKVIKVFNEDGCYLNEGMELPKDHAI